MQKENIRYSHTHPSSQTNPKYGKPTGNTTKSLTMYVKAKT